MHEIALQAQQKPSLPQSAYTAKPFIVIAARSETRWCLGGPTVGSRRRTRWGPNGSERPSRQSAKCIACCL